jgi:hypothetical protein
MVESIHLKDNLNVILFRNPTSNTTNYCVLDVADNSIVAVNKFDWTPVATTSPFYSKAFQFVGSKYKISAQMFINFKSDPFG